MLTGPMQAAFFDLDKTVIAKSSVLAFGRPLYREGLLSRSALLKSAYNQAIYRLRGADEARMQRARDKMLSITRGWEQSTSPGRLSIICAASLMPASNAACWRATSPAKLTTALWSLVRASISAKPTCGVATSGNRSPSSRIIWPGSMGR